MNKKNYLPLIIAILLFLAVWKVYGKEKGNVPERQSWEYKSVILSRATLRPDFSWYEDGKNYQVLPIWCQKQKNLAPGLGINHYCTNSKSNGRLCRLYQ